jgi:hypothetical protein
MQAAPEKQEPRAVVLDCEVGDNLDNILTLGLLHGLSTLEEPEAQFLAVSLTRSNLQAAAYCDAVGRFYSKVALREFPKRFRRYRGFSVGLEESNPAPPSSALAAALDRKGAEGEPLYPHEVHELVDTADPVALIRNALSAKADDSCAVILAGPATSLAALLGLNGGIEMIRSRVRLLAVAMSPEQALADLPAARRLFAEWPTPIVAIGSTDVRFPANAEFSWAPDHPIADALAKADDVDGTLGLAAALAAIRPDSEGFTYSDAGVIGIDDSGKLTVAPGESGKGRLLTADDESLAGVYRDFVTAEPAPRDPPDFIKRILERQKKEEEEKAAEKKEEPTP